MKRALRIGLIVSGLLLVVVVATLALLPRFLDLDDYIGQLETEIETKIDRNVEIGSLELSLSRGVGLLAREVRIADTTGLGERARAESITFIIKPLDFVFDGVIRLSGVRVHGLTLFVEAPADPEASGLEAALSLLNDEGKSAEEKPDDAVPAEGVTMRSLEKALREAPIEFLQIVDGRIVTLEKDEPLPSFKGVPTLGPVRMHRRPSVSAIQLEFDPLRTFLPVSFRFAARIEPPEGAWGRASLRGSVTFRSADYQIDDAQFLLHGELENFDWSWITDIEPIAELGLQRGRFSGEISASGNPFTEISAEGEIRATDARGDWPFLWAVPFELETARLPFEFFRHGDLYTVRLTDADLNGLHGNLIRMTFAFPKGPQGPLDFIMDLDLDNVRWEKHFEYFPWMRLNDRLREELRERIAREGGASAVTVNLRFDCSQSRHHCPVDWDHFYASGRLSGMKMRVGPGDSGPTLTDLAGQMTLAKPALRFEKTSAKIDGELPVQLSGGFPRLFHGDHILKMDLTGRFDVQRLAATESKYQAIRARQAVEILSRARGPANGKATVTLDTDTGEMKYDTTLHFDGVRLPMPSLGAELRQITGDVRVTTGVVESGFLSATMGGAPLRFNFLIDAEQAHEFSLSVNGEGLPLDPMLRSLGGEGFSGQGVLGLRNIKLTGPTGGEGAMSVEGSVAVNSQHLQTPFSAQPIEDLECIFNLQRSGRNDLGCRWLFNATDVELSGYISGAEEGSPEATFALGSNYMDAADLIQHLQHDRFGEYVESVTNQQNADSLAATTLVSPQRLLAEGQLTLNADVGSFEWGKLRGRNLKTTLIWRDGAARFARLTFMGPGGPYEFTEGRLHHDPVEGYVVSARPRLEGLRLPEFLEFLGARSGVNSGTISVRGELSTSGRDVAEFPRGLGGQLSVDARNGIIEDIRQAEVLAQILTFLNWRGLDRYDEGVPFKEVTGDFRLEKGVARTTNLVFNSEKFRIGARGRIDLVTTDLNMIASVRVMLPTEFAFDRLPPRLQALIPPIIPRGFDLPVIRVTGKLEAPEVGATEENPDTDPSN